ncbi:type VI secretion system membrane subunit TssM [Kaarinaea lacus]
MIRWIIIAIGFIALSLLIWFGGPMVSVNDYVPLGTVTARLLTIIIIILVWAIFQLWKQVKAKKDNEGLIAGLESSVQQAAPAPAESGAAQEDVGQLQQNFNDALSVLRKTKLKGIQGEQQLYELPWYIIIGPPGSGKTTAIINSGLRFPLGERFGKQALRGVGGTRDCDFWFTDEAVLVDTAGRYTTQDSHAEVDKAGWDGFLELLKKHRRRRPINGVMVGISLAELMQQSEAERMHHANTIKQRIQELYHKLGIPFPVYVLFTKTDLIAGFMEFFDDLGREEREQVWGFTFPMDSPANPEGVVHLFANEFDALIARLNARLSHRMHQERDLSRRAQIHAFPHQLASLKQMADSFLQDIFRPSRYESRFLLRGVYFTSGTQEGTPIDRIMGSLAGIFGLDRQAAPQFSGQGRSYFLTNLFKYVIFPESGVAGTDRRLEKQRAWLLRGAYAASVIVTLVATLVWVGSYTANANHIAVLEDHIDNYEKLSKEAKPSSDIVAVLPAINELNQARNVYADSGLSWLSGLGLSKRGSMEPAADEAYRRALVAEFLPRIGSRLEYQLKTGAKDTEFLHSALKAYLMLYDLKHLDPEYIKLWMELDWQNNFAGDHARIDQLTNHLNALFENNFEPIKVNPTLVANSRRILQQVPVSQRVYNRLKQEASVNKEYAVNLPTVLGTLGQTVLRFKKETSTLTNIPSIFTYRGFHQVYLKEGVQFATETSEETWVLGDVQASKINPDVVNKQVRDLYIKDYINTWSSALANIELVRFKNLNQAIDSLEILSGPQSPLSSLLTVVDENTALTRVPDVPEAEVAANVAKQLSSTARRVNSAMKRAKATGASKLLEGGPGSEVEKAFEPIQELVQGGENTPPQLNGLLTQVAEVYNFVAGIGAGSSGTAAMQVAAQRMSGGSSDAIGRLRTKATRLSEPVKGWLMDAADNSWSIILGEAHGHINSIWQSDIVPSFDRALKNRYPLRRTSSDEITLTDFANFFGPGGELEVFFNNYLKPFVIVKRRGWQLRSFEGRSIGISRESLNAFENAAVIKNTFFPGGETAPMVTFSLRPQYLDANITSFHLEIDGQKLTYRHGPMRSTNLQWPGPDGSSRVRMTFEASSGSHISRTKEGPWGLFRLLDTSEVVKTSLSDRYKVTFEISGHKAQYELRADSVVNPFRLSALERFNCPKRI